MLSSIGIIGGADGPTLIFVTGSISPYAVVAGCVLAIAVGWLLFRLWKRRK